MNDDYQEIGQHYNNLIWVIFGGAITLTLYILFLIWFNNKIINNLLARYLLLIFGYSILFYAILVIESFGQKKTLAFKKSKIGFDTFMKGKIKYLEIPPLSFIIITYIITSFYFSLNYFIDIIFYGSLIFPGLMILGFIYVINCWRNRNSKPSHNL